MRIKFIRNRTSTFIVMSLCICTSWLPPSFTVSNFKNTEKFLDRLPSGYHYALGFRHSSWNTERHGKCLSITILQ